SIKGMGGRLRWRDVAPRMLFGQQKARAHPGRHVAGAGPLSGEGRTMRDPELVARAQRAATRLESAWEQWRALHGLADAPGQPVPFQAGPLQSGPLQQVKLAGTGPEGTGEYPSPALLNAPSLNAPSAVGRGRPSPDQPRDVAELAGWNQGELPSQRSEQLASW